MFTGFELKYPFLGIYPEEKTYTKELYATFLHSGRKYVIKT